MKLKEGYRRQRRRWMPNPRQRSVLAALAGGKTNAEIGAHLGMTADGAKWYVSELLRETGLTNRRELARWWTGLPAEPGHVAGFRGPTMVLESPATSQSWTSESPVRASKAGVI